MRVGVVSGPKPIVDRIALHMQVSSVHASGLSQVSGDPTLAHAYLKYKPNAYHGAAQHFAENNFAKTVLCSFSEKKFLSNTLPNFSLFRKFDQSLQKIRYCLTGCTTRISFNVYLCIDLSTTLSYSLLFHYNL